MIPIHELLSRIRWDRGFGRGSFEIGYWDRVEGKILRMPLALMHPDPDNPRELRFVDGEGIVHTLPLHRIREVVRDGIVIWRR